MATQQTKKKKTFGFLPPMVQFLTGVGLPSRRRKWRAAILAQDDKVEEDPQQQLQLQPAHSPQLHSTQPAHSQSTHLGAPQHTQLAPRLAMTTHVQHGSEHGGPSQPNRLYMAPGQSGMRTDEYHNNEEEEDGMEEDDEEDNPSEAPEEDESEVELDTVNTPIHKLPVDILLEVFEMSLRNSTASHNAPARYNPKEPKDIISSNISKNPVNLGLVCRYWRNVSFLVPAIWTIINVANPTDEDVVRLEMWLKRSGNCLLTMSIQENYSHKGSAMDAVMKVALDHHRRWRRMTLAVVSDAENAFMASRVGSLPNLEYMSIIGMGRMKSVAQEGFYYCMYRDAPKLRHLKLGFKIDIITLCKCPWEQLVSVDLRTVFTDHLYMILSRCRNMQDLHIRSIEGRLDYPFQQPVILPNLEVFAFPADDSVSRLYEGLLLPSLKELNLKRGGTWSQRSDSWHSLENMLVRSGCRLLKFVYSISVPNDMPMTDPLFTMLLSPVLQHVEELHVESKVNHSSITILAHRETSHLMPNLKKIQIGRGNSVDEGTANFIMSSRKQCHPLPPPPPPPPPPA
ncbi:hypothetical protein FA15DRAFT_220201 [Coprinopsis marcescibilis]|uniref:F-box domain-containing protein n=1 Tax=Coprinopsis marcescibilis TaxID=230819 RepID=A0A5C3L3P7_COPMA|nr:hypothetical protein FA15DRAFT_220201 [Coprinopsis marcescibilis]